MSWSNEYVGIPYADMGRARTGCDCWGLARLVYNEQLKAALPDYANGYASAEEQGEVASLIGRETGASVWTPVVSLAEFDLLLFRHGRHESHIGISLGTGLMLHMANDDQSKIERFDQGRWVNRFVSGFRHISQTSQTSQSSKGVL